MEIIINRVKVSVFRFEVDVAALRHIYVQFVVLASYAPVSACARFHCGLTSSINLLCIMFFIL